MSKQERDADTLSYDAHDAHDETRDQSEQGDDEDASLPLDMVSVNHRLLIDALEQSKDLLSRHGGSFSDQTMHMAETQLVQFMSAIQTGKDRAAMSLPEGCAWKIIKSAEGRRVFRVVTEPEFCEDMVIIRIAGTQYHKSAVKSDDQRMPVPAVAAATATATAEGKSTDVTMRSDVATLDASKILTEPAKQMDINMMRIHANGLEPQSMEEIQSLLSREGTKPSLFRVLPITSKMAKCIKQNRVKASELQPFVASHGAWCLATRQAPYAEGKQQMPAPVEVIHPNTLLAQLRDADPMTRHSWRNALKTCRARLLQTRRPGFIVVRMAEWKAFEQAINDRFAALPPSARALRKALRDAGVADVRGSHSQLVARAQATSSAVIEKRQPATPRQLASILVDALAKTMVDARSKVPLGPAELPWRGPRDKTLAGKSWKHIEPELRKPRTVEWHVEGQGDLASIKGQALLYTQSRRQRQGPIMASASHSGSAVTALPANACRQGLVC